MGMRKYSLEKSLTLADVFCISTGAMISSGIFILPGVAFAQIGPAMFLAYALAGVCALMGSLATIELATAMPLAGGIYFYTGRSLGGLAGTVSGLLNWSAISLKSAFAIFGLSEVLHQFFGWNAIGSGVVLTLIFLAVNLVGTRAAAAAQVVMVGLLLVVMGCYIGLGLPRLELGRFAPFFAPGSSAANLFAEAAFVFVAFGGLLDVASITEEVRNPRRNLPLGMISAIIAVTLIYVLTLIVTVGILPAEKLAGSLTPLADAGRRYFGLPGFAVITFGAVMAFVTTANAGVMAAARFPYAMGRDRLVPAFFARTYGRRQLPLPGLLITAAMMIAVQFLPLEKLVTVASTVIMLSFILTNLAVMILRESGIQSYRPSFRLPLYPVLPVVCIGIFALLIIELGLGSVRIAAAIVVAGFLLFCCFGRKEQRESALQQLVRKVARKRMPYTGLERELREIVRARDQIVEDEFDCAVEAGKMLICRDAGSFTELAARVAPEQAPLLVSREDENSSVVLPFAAIPHLMVPGRERFELVAVKCEPGIPMTADGEAVTAFFFLFCSADQRNLHLRSLTAIAQILQNPSFERQWREAMTPEQLRDLLLLAKRKRAARDR